MYDLSGQLAMSDLRDVEKLKFINDEEKVLG